MLFGVPVTLVRLSSAVITETMGDLADPELGAVQPLLWRPLGREGLPVSERQRTWDFYS